MRLGQAIFGEKSRGHSLLDTSPAAQAIASKIVGRMDLAGTQPPGTIWKPYVSGFLHDDHYVVARTMNDEQAQRAGMVFSRALILPLSDAAVLTDIGGLFKLLADLAQKREPVDDLIWIPSAPTAPPSAALAAALLADGDGPVIWPQQEGFEEAIAGLWRCLWPAGRSSFSFGLAFRSQDLTAKPPIVIAVPASLVGRWGDYRRAGASVLTEGAAEALLVGEAAGEPLRKLMSDLEAEVGAITDLRQLADLHCALADEGDFESGVTALRNAAYLSPDPERGQTVKRMLLSLAIDMMPAADAAAILTTRNLDLAAYANSMTFWNKIAAWTRTELWASADPALAARIIQAAFADAGALSEWKGAVKTGVNAAVAASSTKMIAGAWLVAQAAPKIVEILLSLASDVHSFETALVAHTPRRIAPEEGGALMAIAASGGRLRLHAAVAASFLPPQQAAAVHMEADYDIDTLEIALRNASSKELLDVALGQDVEELFAIAGNAAAQNPKLLVPLVIGNKRWRAIWREALARNPAAWDGPKSPRNSADTLWSDLDLGDSDALQLLRPLAATPLADISAHPARSRLWDRIPTDLTPKILAVSAAAAATAFLAGHFEEGVEEILGAELARPEHTDPMLTALIGDPARGAALFRLLPQLSEAIFRSWCDEVLEFHPSLPAAVAESFGRLIAARVWQSTASHFVSRASTLFSPRSDLRPALRNCLDLVGTFDRWYLGLTSEPANETRWEIFQEVAIELYHTGPGHDELWSRAGGKNGKLPLQGNGAQKWRQVIIQARNGKLDIKMADLVRLMYADYPGNRALTKLHSERLF